jgi:1-phosphofructokinase
VETSSSERPDARRGGVAVFAPSPLLTITLERSTRGADQLHIHLGGQGVWIARLVARFEVPVSLCTVFGGETGDVARHLARDDGIDFRVVESTAWNGGHVHDRRSGDRLVLADVSPAPLSRHELDNLYSTTIAAAIEAGVCVLSGTHRHPVVPHDMYRRLAHDLHSNGVVVVTDVSADQLASALRGGVSLVKVSDEELRRDGWIDGDRDGDDDGSLVGAIDRLVAAGAEGVVVSCGAAPTRARIDGVDYQVTAPTLTPVDHRGAGDAMTGMLAVGLATGRSTEELLRDAAAAGAATVVRHGFATGARDAVHALASIVEVEVT